MGKRFFSPPEDNLENSPFGKIPEEVPEEEIAPAGFWFRLYATILDQTIIALCVALFLLIVPDTFIDAIQEDDIFNLTDHLLYSILLLLSLDIVYYTIFESSPLLATPGKLAFGLFIEDTEHNRCNFSRVFLRNIAKILSKASFYIGYLMAAFTTKKQTLHDIICKTLVQRRVELSRSLLLPSLIFTVVLIYLTESFLTLARARLYSEESSQSVVTERTYYNANTDDIIIPQDGVKSVTINDTIHLSFKSVYTRIINSDSHIAKKGENKAPLNTLEFAFFLEELSEEEQGKLQFLPSLQNDSLAAIGKEPAALMVFDTENALFNCDNTFFSKGEFILNEKVVPENLKSYRFELFPSDLMNNNLLFLKCNRLADKEDLFISFQFRSSRELNENSVSMLWNLRFTTTINSTKEMAPYLFSKYADTFALWKQQSKELEIGFFSGKITQAQFKAFKNSGTLNTPSNRPLLLATIPLKYFKAGMGNDLVHEGYSLLFQDLPETFSDSRGEKSYTVDFPLGARPESLMLVKTSKSFRVQLRLDGSHVVALPNGFSKISWRTTANAPLIIVNR